MPLEATPSIGTKLQIGDALFDSPSSPEEFHDIPGIAEGFAMPEGETLAETPHLGDTHMQYSNVNLPSMVTSLPIDFVPGNTIHEELLAAAEDKLERNFRIVYPEDSPQTTEQFKARIDGKERTFNVQGTIRYTFRLKLTSKPTVVE